MASTLPKITVPYHSPVSPVMYPLLATVLLGVGIVGLLYFFLYEASTSTNGVGQARKTLVKEVVVALVSSVFLGFGALFVLLAVGIYL